MTRTDVEVIAEVDAAFADCAKPDHFVDFAHCEECAEHDALLRSRDRTTLALADVDNPGWDPIALCTLEGFAYFLPALARFALAARAPREGGYEGTLVGHLAMQGRKDRFREVLGERRRRAVVALLEHLALTRHDPCEFTDEEIDGLREQWKP